MLIWEMLIWGYLCYIILLMVRYAHHLHIMYAWIRNHYIQYLLHSCLHYCNYESFGGWGGVIPYHHMDDRMGQIYRDQWPILASIWWEGMTPPHPLKDSGTNTITIVRTTMQQILNIMNSYSTLHDTEVIGISHH